MAEKFSTRILLSKLLLSFLKRTYVSRNALNLNLLNYNMKILQVAFLLLFNYLDSLPKLYIRSLSGPPYLGGLTLDASK